MCACGGRGGLDSLCIWLLNTYLSSLVAQLLVPLWAFLKYIALCRQTTKTMSIDLYYIFDVLKVSLSLIYSTNVFPPNHSLVFEFPIGAPINTYKHISSFNEIMYILCNATFFWLYLLSPKNIFSMNIIFIRINNQTKTFSMLLMLLITFSMIMLLSIIFLINDIGMIIVLCE